MISLLTAAGFHSMSTVGCGRQPASPSDGVPSVGPADRFGYKRMIFVSLSLWIAAVGVAYFTTTKTGFYIVATLAGAGLGSCQSVSRSLFALFTPKDRAAEFSGFLGVAGKALAFIGPLLFGMVSQRTGSQRPAVLSVGVFFLVGMLLLSFVDEKRGKAAAISVKAGML
jgi:UMF1 family MFS transporter